MASTTVQSVKSKQKCLNPYCEQHTLFTNDTPKVDDVMYYRCESCGYSFSDDENSRKYRESQGKGSSDGPSFQIGAVLLVLMAAVVFAITLSAQQEERDNLRQNNSARTQLVAPG